MNYWWAGLSVAAIAPEPVSHTDVAVIGAGYAGLSVALDLLPRHRVDVFEAEHVGFGASGRNSGLLLPLAVLPWLIPGAAGRFNARQALKRLHDRACAQASSLAERHPSAQMRPVTVHLRAPNRVVSAGLSWVADALASTGVPVTSSRRSMALQGWTMHPAKLALSLARAVRSAGGSIHEGSPVRAVSPSRDHVTLTLTDGRLVTAAYAVVCTNAYTNSVALPDPPAAKVQHTYMLATTPLPLDVQQDLGGTDSYVATPSLGMSYRRLHEGRLLFGALGSSKDDPRAQDKLDRELRQRVPRQLTAGYRWGGPIHTTGTETPVIRASAASPRIVYVAGFAGSGVALSLLAGPLSRALLPGGVADEEATELRQAMLSTRFPLRGTASALAGVLARLARA